ncbi:MAG: tetratricopeptide repeat protein [Acidobacteriaceae bacterium]|nr:tetratricopeptide repeat protein [Acidobacteriaceae bacterium]
MLLALVLATYSNSFGNSFHFDDYHTVLENPAIRSLHNLPRFFTDTSTFSIYPANRTYRPLVSASLALDYALGHGYKLFWFHLGTMICFLLLMLLLLQLFRQTMDRAQNGVDHFWPALLGAAWFGLHPAMAETVNYVIQRGDLYCTLGCVAALCLWVGWPKQRRYGVYLLPLIAALLSKPPAAVFPLLLLFWEYFFGEAAMLPASARWKRSALSALPSLLTTAALMKLQSAMTPKSFAPSILDPWSYRVTQPLVWARYVGELLLPLHLNVDTDLKASSASDPAVQLGLVFLLALFAAIAWCWKKESWRPVSYGLLWFVLTQLPTSLYALSEVENDHRMFFSFPGLMLAVLWCGWKLWQHCAAQVATRRALIVCSLLALSGYAYGAHLRNVVWHDEDSLWLDDVQKSPRNGRGLMTYGLTLMGHGHYAEALDYFERALVYTPNYATLEINLGVDCGALADAGDTPRSAQAVRHFERAIALAPEDDTTHAYYGRWLLEHGSAEEAIAQLKQAMLLNPARSFQRDLLIRAYVATGEMQEAHQLAAATASAFPGDVAAEEELQHPVQQDAAFWINRSLAQSRAGLYADSLASAQKALQLDPHSAEACNNIGAAYGAMQQWGEAIRFEQKALELRPGFPIAQNNLAWYRKAKLEASRAPATAAEYINRSLMLNQEAKYEESILAARKALQLDPRSAEAWNNIAAGYESLQRWDEAIAAAQHALAIRPEYVLAKNNLAWSESQKRANAH